MKALAGLIEDIIWKILCQSGYCIRKIISELSLQISCGHEYAKQFYADAYRATPEIINKHFKTGTAPKQMRS